MRCGRTWRRFTFRSPRRGRAGGSSNVHIIENGDLRVPDPLGWFSARGQVVIALGVDDDHDEVHYGTTDGDAEETLQRAVESLTLPLDAVKRVRKL